MTATEPLTRDDLEASFDLCEQIRPLLRGKPPHTQLATLAQLLALAIAGHVIQDELEATDRLRESILATHMTTVKMLIPLMFKQFVEPQIEAAKRLN